MSPPCPHLGELGAEPPLAIALPGCRVQVCGETGGGWGHPLMLVGVLGVSPLGSATHGCQAGGGVCGGVPPERQGAYSTNLEKLPMERKQVPTGSRPPPSSLGGLQLYRGAQAWEGDKGGTGGVTGDEHTAPAPPSPPRAPPYQDGAVMRPHGGPEPLQGLELHGVGGLGTVAPKIVGAGPCVCGGDTPGVTGTRCCSTRGTPPPPSLMCVPPLRVYH